MLTVVELFSGIGSQRAALERAGIQHKIVAFCDIDKFAEQSYRAIFNDNETPNLGDITKVEKLPKCDLLTYSFPCTDISLAGKRKGLVNPNKVDDGLFQLDEAVENTRSGLLYEVQRLLKNSELPKYLLLENVKELVGKKNMRDFQNWCDDLNVLGYNTYWKVLDAQFYGVPQHRERVYAISIRKDIDKGKFRFPQGWELPIRLKDILEENVEEKYYLSDKNIEKLKINSDFMLDSKNHTSGTMCLNSKVNGKQPSLEDRIYSEEGLSTAITTSFLPNVAVQSVGNVNPSGNGMNENVYDEDGLSPTITTNKGEGIKILEATKKGYAIATDGCGVYINRPWQKRECVQKDKIQTLKTSCSDVGVVLLNNNYYRIRKLTPLECWRLMGFEDEQFYRAQKVNSNAQLYKQAGNSIVVNVLIEIFKEMMKNET